MHPTMRAAGKSRIATFLVTGRGEAFIIAQIGSISVKSIIFAPIIFPTERDICFFDIAVSVVMSSGRDVPIARIVMEMILSEMPIAEARKVALSTRRSAPIAIAAAPRINLTEFISTSFFVHSGRLSLFLDIFVCLIAVLMLSYVATAKIANRSIPERTEIEFDTIPKRKRTREAKIIRIDLSI